jgi:hypothetical protein
MQGESSRASITRAKHARGDPESEGPRLRTASRAGSLMRASERTGRAGVDSMTVPALQTWTIQHPPFMRQSGRDVAGPGDGTPEPLGLV